MHKRKCTRSAVLHSIDAALLLCFKQCKIEMKINDSRLSTRTHWCPLMAIDRQIQMAPLECIAEGWFYRAAQRFVRSGVSQWWMKQMMELSDFLWSSLTHWRHISVRKKNHWIKHVFLSGWVWSPLLFKICRLFSICDWYVFFGVFFLFFRSVRDDFGSVIGKCQGKTSFISHTLCV